MNRFSKCSIVAVLAFGTLPFAAIMQANAQSASPAPPAFVPAPMPASTLAPMPAEASTSAAPVIATDTSAPVMPAEASQAVSAAPVQAAAPPAPVPVNTQPAALPEALNAPVAPADSETDPADNMLNPVRRGKSPAGKSPAARSLPATLDPPASAVRAPSSYAPPVHSARSASSLIPKTWGGQAQPHSPVPVRNNQQAQSAQSGAPQPYSHDDGMPSLSHPGLPGAGIPKFETGTDDPSSESVNKYNQARQKAYPMSTSMIDAYHDEYAAQNRAASAYPQQPDAQTSAIRVSLEPGANIPEIRVSPNSGGTLVFLDAEGHPWPFEEFHISNKAGFETTMMGKGANLLTIQPLLREPAWATLTIAMKSPDAKDAKGDPMPNIPVILKIVVDERNNDARRDVHIMAIGPNSTHDGVTAAGIRAGRPGDVDLMRFLSGADVPDGSKSVGISFLASGEGLNAQGWLYNKKLYIRTPLSLASPSYSDSLSGFDGMKVYALNKNNVLLFSVDGRMVSARVDLP